MTVNRKFPVPTLWIEEERLKNQWKNQLTPYLILVPEKEAANGWLTRHEEIKHEAGQVVCSTNQLNKEAVDHFWTKLFTFTEWEAGKGHWGMKEFQAFQAKNKYLLMAYHPARTKELGRLIATTSSVKELTIPYESLLVDLFRKPPTRSAHVNSIQHMLGYFKQDLSPEQKAGVQQMLDAYITGQTGLDEIRKLLLQWAMEFGKTYIANQTYLKPFPPFLREINWDSQ